MRPEINKTDLLSDQRDYARQSHGFKKRANSFLISLAAAVIIAGITALWCFVPGGMAATIFALSAIGIVYLIKHAFVNWNEKSAREDLQTELQFVEEAFSENKKSSKLYNDLGPQLESRFDQENPLHFNNPLMPVRPKKVRRENHFEIENNLSPANSYR
jgi:hypothetical protein